MRYLKNIILNSITVIALGAIGFVFSTIESDWDPVVMGLILIVSFAWIFLFCVANEERF